MSVFTNATEPRWTLAKAGAVPGTGKRSAYQHWLRHPRNGSIKRALLAVLGSLRGVSVPPSSWDDIPRSRERNWKRHRGTQWREQA